MKRQVSYRWRLREIMAEHSMFSTTELVRPLADRGITLSASQVHCLVTGTPERLSLPVLAALCDIFDITAAKVIPTTASNVTRKAATAGSDPVVDLAVPPPPDRRTAGPPACLTWLHKPHTAHQ
jgi:hypothetical protein